MNDGDEHAFSRVHQLIRKGYKPDFKWSVDDVIRLQHFVFPDVYVDHTGFVFSDALGRDEQLRIDPDDRKGFAKLIQGLRLPTPWETFKAVWMARIVLAILAMVILGGSWLMARFIEKFF